MDVTKKAAEDAKAQALRAAEAAKEEARKVAEAARDETKRAASKYLPTHQQRGRRFLRQPRQLRKRPGKLREMRPSELPVSTFPTQQWREAL